MLLLFATLILSSFAQAAPTTLLLDLRNNGHHRAIRPLADCQWLESDLVETLKPDMVNVGMGSVLRIGENLQVKMLGATDKPVWQKVNSLPAYRDNGSLIHRFVELHQKHGKRGIFYETPENIETLYRTGVGLALKPGDLIVSQGDPAQMRYLFGASVVEFSVLEPVVEEGVTLYRPTGPRGAIAMETVAKTAETVFPTHFLTMTAERQRRKLKKSRSCADHLANEKKP